MRTYITAAVLLLPPVAAMADPLAICLDESPDRATAETCKYLVYEACKQRTGDDSTMGEVTCLGEEVEAWDRALNELWPQVKAGADAADAADPGGQGVNAQTLLQAQRSWLAFRDAECAWDYQRYAAGTLRSIVGASCVLEMTAERALDFRDWLAEGL